MSKISFPKIDLSDVKGVMIDIDNTLYLYQPCHEYALEVCYKKFFADRLSFQDFATMYRQHRNDVTKSLSPQGACRSRFFAFQHLLEEMGEDQSYQKALMLDRLYWNEFISVMQIEKDAQDFLNECKRKSLPVCAVTDMLAVIQVEKIQKLQLIEHINYMVTSEEAGKEKPHAEMFLLALEKLYLHKQEVIMIGDSEEKDVNGGNSIGIESYKVEIIL